MTLYRAIPMQLTNKKNILWIILAISETKFQWHKCKQYFGYSKVWKTLQDFWRIFQCYSLFLCFYTTPVLCTATAVKFTLQTLEEDSPKKSLCHLAFWICRKVFFWWHLVAFIDHYTHLYKILRHLLSYLQLYNTQHAYNLLENTRYCHSCCSQYIWGNKEQYFWQLYQFKGHRLQSSLDDID